MGERVTSTARGAVESEQDSEQVWRQAIRERVGGLAAEPKARLNALVNVRRVFQEEIAAAAEPALNAALVTEDRGDLQSRRELCSWANWQLRELGLAIRDRTGRPAILLADPKDAGDDIGRFRLEHRDSDGRVAKTLASRSLPSLALMADPPRAEPFARSSRRRNDQGPAR